MGHLDYAAMIPYVASATGKQMTFVGWSQGVTAFLLCFIASAAASPVDMAWRCGAKTNAGLVQNLKAAGIIKSARVESIMLSLDRQLYAPPNTGYEDSPQRIGHAATISAPAWMSM